MAVRSLRHEASGARTPRHENVRSTGVPVGESALGPGTRGLRQAYDLIERWYCMTAKGAQTTTIPIAQISV